MTADQLIPLLLLVIIRANVLNLESNLFFMKNFTFLHDVISGEYGFALSSLEAVIQYVDSSFSFLKEQSDANLDFWNVVKSGSIELVLEYFDGRKKAPLSPHGESSSISPSSPISSPELTFTTISEYDALSRPLPTSPKETSLTSSINSIISSRNWDGDTAIIMATRENQISMVKTLIQLSLPSDTPNYHQDTPLHVACSNGNLKLTQLLLESYVLVDVMNELGDTPFLTSIRYHHQIISETLVLSGCHLNHQNHQGLSALHLAVNPSLILYLSSLSINPNLISSEGLSPLLYHSQQGSTSSVLALLSSFPQVNLNAQDLGHRTCLHLCCFRGYQEIVVKLFQMKSLQVNPKSVRGNTPLHAASDAGHFEIVKILLEGGADPSLPNGQGKVAGDLAKEPFVLELLDGNEIYIFIFTSILFKHGRLVVRFYFILS